MKTFALALRNLLENAIKFTAGRPRREIEVGVRRVGVHALFWVRDNGPGIPEDLRPNIFDPFVTTRATGSGLGLALVAKIVGDHGGLIEVNSRSGRTEFRVHLPMMPDDSEEPGH